jgi:RNA polymerase sigma-70 factor, ECF subfamily
VDQHRSQVLSTARRWGVPAEMEQDAVQEVFLRVFNKLHLFRPEKPFAYWLSAITRNTCAKLRRHWCHRNKLSAVFESAAADIEETDLLHSRTPEHEASAREQFHALEKALAALSPRERDLFEKQHLEGETNAQTAVRLGIAPVAARVAAHRIRSKLKGAMEPWSPRSA